MDTVALTNPVVAGSRGGMGIVYDTSGEMICEPGETIVRRMLNWDMDVISPWRRVMPHTLFEGYHGKASSRLYVTSARIVLVRDIDEWRQLAGELYPLGLPNAAIKEATLRRLKKEGIRQFCALRTAALRLARVRKFTKAGSMIDLRLIGTDNRQYGVMIWQTVGKDDKDLLLVQSRFLR